MSGTNPAEARNPRRETDSAFSLSLEDKVLLSDVHKTLRKLGLNDKRSSLPEVDPELKVALKGLSVLMIDSSLEALQRWAPILTTATAGNFSYLHLAERVGFEDIGAAVLQKNPDLILLASDFGVQGFTVWDVTDDLVKGRKITSLIVGFSSSASCRQLFKQRGFPHTANKADVEQGSKELADAASCYDQYAIEKKRGSLLLQEMDQRFAQNNGEAIYQTALTRLAAAQDMQLLTSGGFEDADDYRGRLHNMADTALVEYKDSPFKYKDSSFRRLLSVLEIDEGVMHPRAAGISFKESREHPAALEHLQNIVSSLPPVYSELLHGYTLRRAAACRGNFALLFEKLEADGTRQWKLVTANEQVGFSGMEEVLSVGLGIDGQVIVVGSADDGKTLCICDGKRFIKEPCDDPKAVRVYFSTGTQGEYDRATYVVDIGGRLLVNGSLYRPHSQDQDVLSWSYTLYRESSQVLELPFHSAKRECTFTSESSSSQGQVFKHLERAKSEM